MSDIYSVLGNRVRARLVLCLSDGPKNVMALVENCGLSQSAVSQHLAKLKRARVVEARKKGKIVWYSLRYKKAAKVARLLESLEKEAV